MYEHSTKPGQTKKKTKIHTATKATDTERMGTVRKRCRSRRKTSNPSNHAVPMEKGLKSGCTDVSQRQTSKSRSAEQRTRTRKHKTQRGSGVTNPGTDAVKKKDELGLTNRRKGSFYSKTQRARIVDEIERLFVRGIKKTETLKTLGVCRSTYYFWLKDQNSKSKEPSVQRLTDSERQAIIEKKKDQPQLSHRKLSGYLRSGGVWVSSSSCYRLLKSFGWVLPQKLRSAPWKTPHYEPFKPNAIWGEDWTIINIACSRYYLLTVIDYFSRYIVAWGVVKSVTQTEVGNLIALAYMDQGIENSPGKPMLRVDRGSPNMAHNTRKLIKDLELVLSPSRAYRPTDNAIQERWYRTVKQEEIYCYPSYPSEEIARDLLSKYIQEYNENRPHQALWNFTPEYAHRLGNKSRLLSEYNQMVRIAKERRININRMNGNRAA